MKYVVLVPDGCADEPVAELGSRTPLEVASMPNLRRLAARAEIGRASVIPPGMSPGSDVGNMAILGYDPLRYSSGRAPIEAAAMGIELEPDQVAFRCNLVTVNDDGTMVDFAAGHITTEQSRPIITALDKTLGGNGIRFHSGVEYRHLAVLPAELGDAECVPPHDLTGKPLVAPSGPAGAKLSDLMEASRPVVLEEAEKVGAAATQIWLWGQGKSLALPSFSDRYGVTGRLSSAVDLVRGLGVLIGLEVVDVPGATAGFDNDYAAQRDACLTSLDDRDFFLLHVEATDEAGHQGLTAEKVRALEHWDADIIGPLVDTIEARSPLRILFLPDHATPLRMRTHTPDPVPYLLYDSEREQVGGEYTESATSGLVPVDAHQLLPRMLAAVPA